MPVGNAKIIVEMTIGDHRMQATDSGKVAISTGGSRARLSHSLHGLTKKWGTRAEVTLYQRSAAAAPCQAAESALIVT